MVVTWYGGRCLLVEERIRGETPRSALLYPETKTSRARTLEEKANVIIATRVEPLPESSAYRITVPGEYDVAGFSIRGVPIGGGAAQAFLVEAGGVTFAMPGFGGSGTLTDREVEMLGVVDVLALPVPFRGGAKDAARGLREAVSAIEPSIVVLLSDASLRAAVRRELGSNGESLAKLAVAPRDFPEEGFRVVFLEPQ